MCDAVDVAEHETAAQGPILFDLTGKRVYVAGHAGMVGQAIMRRLGQENCTVLTGDRRVLDLTRQEVVERWLNAEKPDVVIVAAAKVGGIAFNNSQPVEFLADNLAIALNLSTPPMRTGLRNCCFSARPASIRGSRRSRCVRTCC